jgi:hypothetical protein
MIGGYKPSVLERLLRNISVMVPWEVQDCNLQHIRPYDVIQY